MKQTHHLNLKTVPSNIWRAFCLVSILLFSACEKEDNTGASFALKDNPSDMSVSSQGTSQTFTVQTTGSWSVEPIRQERWLKIDPATGSGEDTFTVTVDRNTTLEPRKAILTFVVDGKIQNKVLQIDQEAGHQNNGNDEVYVTLDGLTSLEVPEEGLQGRYAVRSTGDWKIEILEGAEWLKIAPMQGRFDTGVDIEADLNSSPQPRTARLAFYLNGQQLPETLDVNQQGMQVILYEDFSWLTYGNTVFNTTTGETRIGLWNESELARGWTGTINPVSGGGNYSSTYARPGFVKLGRTNFGGDIISPKLVALEGTKNLKVSFKAVVYMTAGGNADHNLLKVGVNGPGNVSVSEFYINNKPDYTNDPQCIEAWKRPEATYSFTITGATAETQIWFLGGDFDLRAETGWPKNVNRIFLDDILVTPLK